MENKNMVNLLLTTEELNKDNERASEIEVLNKEELKAIIDDIDISKTAHEAYDIARGYSLSGYIEVDIDARDGEICMSFRESGNINVGYFNTFINLFNIETGDGIGDEYKYPEHEIYLFTEDEHIEYFEELEERNYRIRNKEEDGEILNEYEIADMVAEKFNLDKDELLEEYYKLTDSENVEWDDDRINEQIEELYSHQI